jgi:hypothetical protein
MPERVDDAVMTHRIMWTAAVPLFGVAYAFVWAIVMLVRNQIGPAFGLLLAGMASGVIWSVLVLSASTGVCWAVSAVAVAAAWIVDSRLLRA